MQEFEKLRRHPRAPVNSLVGVREGSQFHFVNSLEISEGGILLESTKNYEVGERLELTLKVPYAEQITVIGEVIYILNAVGHAASVAGWGVGIRFVNISVPAQILIRQYVEQHAVKDE